MRASLTDEQKRTVEKLLEPVMVIATHPIEEFGMWKYEKCLYCGEENVGYPGSGSIWERFSCGTFVSKLKHADTWTQSDNCKKLAKVKDERDYLMYEVARFRGKQYSPSSSTCPHFKKLSSIPDDQAWSVVDEFCVGCQLVKLAKELEEQPNMDDPYLRVARRQVERTFEEVKDR